MKSNDLSSSYGFQEDLKRYRKLRKLLRQIEHLQILSRPLNDEEKYKCSKRDPYRKELNSLNEKYSNSQLLNELKKEDNNSYEQENDNSHLFLNNTESEISINQSNDKSLNSTTDELNTKLAHLNLNTEVEQSTLPEEINRDPLPIVQVNLKQQENNDTGLNQTQEKSSQSKKSKKQNTKEDKPGVPQPQPQQKFKPKIFFDYFQIENSHEDIITSIDISMDSNLLVTGSRDTTIKVWNLNNGKLSYSFGGHTGPITSVKFWSLKFYLDSIENLKKLSDYDDDDDLPDLNKEEIEEDNGDNETIKNDTKKNSPFILSSSLDCSFRLWSTVKGKCLKQFYLYNPISSFDVFGTSFLIALDAGKIGYINNMKEICCPKLLNDTESFRCVKFLENEQFKFYALTQCGNLVFVSINNLNQLEITDNVNIYSIMSKLSCKFSQNFKRFELINNEKLLIINDNQSYVILYDLNYRDNFKLVSTNTSKYGFTNCLCKFESQFLINSFNIDTGTSSINVFGFEKNESDFFKYKYTIQEDDLDSYCISAMCCAKLDQHSQENNFYTLVTSSNKNLKVWSIQEMLDVSTNTASNKNRKDQAKYLKMCKEVDLSSNDDQELSTDNDEDEENTIEKRKENKYEDYENEEQKKKGYCLIQ